MIRQLAQDYQFDRPIIIVSAPRSGSTLLFETMCRAKSLWTIGDESHMVFEHIKKLNPAYGICASNRLVGDDADSASVQHLRGIFFEHLRDAEGRLYRDIEPDSAEKPRFLEKTPKNSLRIPFLNRLFPDALYIYLFRDPRENLSSMIEGWRSQDFVTYPQLPEWPDKWSFLLPPDYQRVRGKPLEEIVAFQWQAANQFILDDLGAMPEDRWTAASYAELVADAPATIARVCRFAGIPFDDSLKAHCATALPFSRYTKTTPKSGKWRMNEAMIQRVMPGLQPLIQRMEARVAPHTSSPVMVSEAQDSGDAIAQPPEAAQNEQPKKQLGRNERCDCGSGLRFKHCHGKL